MSKPRLKHGIFNGKEGWRCEGFSNIFNCHAVTYGYTVEQAYKRFVDYYLNEGEERYDILPPQPCNPRLRN